MLKREVVSVYVVTTIDTKNKLSESKIHKNGQKYVFLCLYYSANSIIHKKKCSHDQFTKHLLPKFQIISEPNAVKIVYPQTENHMQVKYNHHQSKRKHNKMGNPKTTQRRSTPLSCSSRTYNTTALPTHPSATIP